MLESHRHWDMHKHMAKGNHYTPATWGREEEAESASYAEGWAHLFGTSMESLFASWLVAILKEVGFDNQ